jgi:hypothetical protein
MLREAARYLFEIAEHLARLQRFVEGAYSTPNLPLIPAQACHPFQTKAATDSRAKLPPWQMTPGCRLERLDAG